MPWFLLTITASFFASFYMELNRHLQLDGMQLNFWRILVQVLTLGPIFLLLFSWPTNPYFYVVGVIGGVAFAVIDSYLWTISGRHNGRVASLFGPVQTVAAVSIWFFVAPADFLLLAANPWKAALILFSLGLIVSGSVGMRRNAVAWPIFKIMLLIGFIYGLLFVMRKMVIAPDSQVFLEVAQIFVLHYIVGLITLTAYLGARMGKKVFQPQKAMLKGAFLMAFTIFASMVLINVAAVLAPNPGYATAVYLVYPIWLLLYHKLTGVRDNASPYAGSLVVIGVILLMLVTA